MSYLEYIEKETLHAEWMEIMFQMIALGIILLTFSKSNKHLKKLIFIPIIILIIGITIGIYSIYYTYFLLNKENYDHNRYYTWKYISIIIVILLLLMTGFIIKWSVTN